MIHERVFRPQRVRHTAHEHHEIARFELIFPFARGRRPQRDGRMAAGEPPVFVNVVAMQLDIRARGERELMKRRRINRVEHLGQCGINPATLMSVDNTEIRIGDGWFCIHNIGSICNSR